MSMAFPPHGAAGPAPAGKPAGLRLRLQVNTSGAWRNVIEFERGDDVACANVIAAAPLLAAAAGPGATLRICSRHEDLAYSHWQADEGWAGVLPA